MNPSDRCLCGKPFAQHAPQRFGRGPQVAICPGRAQRSVFTPAASATIAADLNEQQVAAPPKAGKGSASA